MMNRGMGVQAILPLLLLVACGESGESDDTGDTFAPGETPVRACVVPAGASPEATTLDALRQLEQVNLTVTDAGEGTPPEGCESLLGWLSGSPPPETGTPRWVQLSQGEDGEAWTVSWTDGSAIGAPLPPVGMHLDLSWRQQDASPFAGEYGELRLLLSETDGGALWVWAETATRLEAMTPPSGVSLALGPQEHSRAETCGEVRWHELSLTLSGETASLPNGTSAEVAGLRATNGGLSVVAGLSCSETADGSARAAISHL